MPGNPPVDALVLFAEVLVEVSVEDGVDASVAQAQNVANAVDESILNLQSSQKVPWEKGHFLPALTSDWLSNQASNLEGY